jgi:prolyl-tRNA synthetase
LTGQNVQVLYDDRDVRPGEKFADADLMGIPWRVVVSSKTLANETYELKARTASEAQQLGLEQLLPLIGGKI